jgi:alpha-tubulin suppressor-like RCC1 family protein
MENGELSTTDEMVVLCQESSIEIYKGSNDNNEMHIAFQVENLKKDPWIIMSKGETIVHINLKDHMDRIVQVDHDDETELIVTSMPTEVLSEFDGDYEQAYFGTDDGEDLDESDPSN